VVCDETDLCSLDCERLMQQTKKRKEKIC